MPLLRAGGRSCLTSLGPKAFLQHLREQKLDLDQIAECFCVVTRGFKCPPRPLSPKQSQKTFRMKELAQFVVKLLQPYQTAELADAQDRTKELERQLAQQRKRTHSEAEIGPEPIFQLTVLSDLSVRWYSI